MRPTIHSTLLAFLLCSCSNYDFAKVRTATGAWDMPRLIADLQASGEESLSSGIWIPFLYLDLVTFEPSRPDMPAGYTLTDLTAVGPIFCAGAADTFMVDPAGERIETSDRWWFGWGLLLHDYDEYVETRHGVRCHGRFRWLGLFGKDSNHYVTRTTASDPATQQ